MKLIVSFLALLAYFLVCVQSESCETTSKCEDTDFTKTSCTSNVCDCEDGYVAVNGGCGKKIAKPAVTVDTAPTKSNEVVSGQSVKLKCTVPASTPSVSPDSYEWYEDDSTTPVNQKTAATYDVTITANKQFSCKAISTETVLSSDKSDKLSITMVADIASATAPTVSSAQAVMTGVDAASYNLECVGLATGVTGNIKLADDNDFTGTISDATTQVKCKAEGGGSSSGDVNAVPNAAFATEVATPTIDKGTSITWQKDKALKLKCVNSVLSPTPTYKWLKDDGTDAPGTINGAEYTVVVDTAGTFKFQCQMPATGAPKKSQVITVTIEDPLAAPEILPNALSYGPGSRAVLTCGQPVTGGYYNWKKGSDSLTGLYDRIIQLDNLANADNGDYKCNVQKENFDASSDSAARTLAISYFKSLSLTGPTKPLASTKATFTCKVELNDGVSGKLAYTWKKDSTALATTTNTHTIDSYAASNDGTYKCTPKLTIGETEHAGTEQTLAVALSATPEKPSVVSDVDIVNGNPVYSKTGDYILSCSSGSVTDSAKYVWKKGSNTLSTTGMTYSIDNALASTHDGSYACSIKIGDATSAESDALTIAIADKAGKPCNSPSDCIPTTVYTGVCTSSVCVCAADAKVDGRVCSGAPAALTGSILLMLASRVLTALM